MTKNIVITALLLSAAATLAHADPYGPPPGAYATPAPTGFEDSARVISVTPQMERFNQPRRECSTEYVTVPQQQSRGIAGPLIGGVTGAIVGNQVGGGNGRTAATALGAITGAIVGDRVGNDQGYYEQQRPVQRCTTVDQWQTRTNGYAVTYEYHGRQYTSVMPYDPGERLRLHVSITPRI